MLPSLPFLEATSGELQLLRMKRGSFVWVSDDSKRRLICAAGLLCCGQEAGQSVRTRESVLLICVAGRCADKRKPASGFLAVFSQL